MFNLRISYAFTFLFGLCAADRAKVSSKRKGNAGFVIDRESIVGFSVIFVVRYLDFETGLLFFYYYYFGFVCQRAVSNLSTLFIYLLIFSFPCIGTLKIK